MRFDTFTVDLMSDKFYVPLPEVTLSWIDCYACLLEAEKLDADPFYVAPRLWNESFT